MVEQGTGGRIIQVGSVQAFRALRHRAGYALSKAAIVQMVRSFAYELGGTGITVNGLLPGFFKTDINHDLFAQEAWFERFKRQVPMLVPGSAEQLDTTLLYLASPASRYTTGTTVSVDGGLIAGIPL